MRSPTGHLLSSKLHPLLSEWLRQEWDESHSRAAARRAIVLSGSSRASPPVFGRVDRSVSQIIYAHTVGTEVIKVEIHLRWRVDSDVDRLSMINAE
jgi:hypothetical protein